MTTSAAELVFHSDSPEATLAIGHALGRVAEPGLVVALVGPLGAGKTQFVRGVVQGLDVPDPRVVSSPTFVLLQEYAGRLPIYHFDTYRLTSPRQFADLGPEEYFEGNGICLVEWADRIASQLPDDRLELRIAMDGPTQRTLTFTPIGLGIAARVFGGLRKIGPAAQKASMQ